MRAFELIRTDALPDVSLIRRKNQIFIIHSVRTAVSAALLIFGILYQAFQSPFINLDIWMPVYTALGLVFAANGLFFSFFDEWHEKASANGLLFVMDAVAISGVIYFIGTYNSFFVLFYLLNIMLTGLVFERWGGIIMAFLTAILFNWLFVVDPSLAGANLYLALALNNIAFFSVAYLSGSLGDQIHVLGEQLQERKKDIEALEDFNRLIVENIATGLVTLNRQGLVTHFNEAAQRILEKSKLDGVALKELFPEVAEKLKTEVFGPGESHRYEVSYRNQKNEKLIIESVVSPVMGPHGEFKGHVVSFQDLTQVKRLERAMRQKEKLAAVGQLAAGIAHEIRNPLASISGSIQLMSSSSENLTDEERRLMTIVLREIDRLNGLITEFLDFVRPDEKVEDPVRVNSVLKEVLEMVRFNKSVRDDVKQSLNFMSENVILGDHNKLKQALLNIILNAYQAMEKVEVAELKVETYDEENKVIVKIEDTGVGMTEDEAQRIFEPFHTTKPKGTGLGLAVTHKVLENHGAKVFVESEKGKGTTFTIEFPGEKNSYPGEQAQRMHA